MATRPTVGRDKEEVFYRPNSRITKWIFNEVISVCKVKFLQTKLASVKRNLRWFNKIYLHVLYTYRLFDASTEFNFGANSRFLRTVWRSQWKRISFTYIKLGFSTFDLFPAGKREFKQFKGSMISRVIRERCLFGIYVGDKRSSIVPKISEYIMKKTTFRVSIEK